MNDQNRDGSAPADADLVLRTRSGDVEAFEELWRRHQAAGIAAACAVSAATDSDDLVQDAYARIHQAIRKGGGPNGSFRAYLFAIIRNTAASKTRSGSVSTSEELDTTDRSLETALDDSLEAGLIAEAFRALPSRCQEALWYCEVERMKAVEIAPLLGVTADEVAPLRLGARASLHDEWMHAHRPSIAEAAEERPAGQHAISEPAHVADRLTPVLLPLVLGSVGASRYGAAMPHGSAAVVQSTTMPAHITGETLDPDEARSTSRGLRAVGRRTGGPTAGSSAGRRAGIGALIGTGSAALVVAGVVAAIAVVPRILDAEPMISQPNASESSASSIASELVPDASMQTDEPMIVDVPTPPPAIIDPVPEKGHGGDTRTDDLRAEGEQVFPPPVSNSRPSSPERPAAESTPPAAQPPEDETADGGPRPAPQPDPAPAPEGSVDPAPDPAPEESVDPEPAPGEAVEPDGDAAEDPSESGIDDPTDAAEEADAESDLDESDPTGPDPAKQAQAGLELDVTAGTQTLETAAE